jgi:hypothetical protein
MPPSTLTFTKYTHQKPMFSGHICVIQPMLKSFIRKMPNFATDQNDADRCGGAPEPG